MTRADAEQFIRSLEGLGYSATLEHVCGDTYFVRVTEISWLTIRSPKQARFVLKHIKPCGEKGTNS